MSDNSLSQTGETARMLYELATEHYAQGDFSAARSFYEQALAIQERAAGAPNPETARYLHGLGNALKELGDYAAAQATLERALVMREQTLGAEHPDIAESWHSLGEVIFDRGDFEAGHQFTERALVMRERLLGAEHPDTIESLKNYALQLAYQGHRAEAEPLLERGLATCERVFGENHRSTAKLLNALGVFWAADKETRPKARLMHERALAVNQAVKGPNHPDTALSLNNLAALLADLGDKEAALALLGRSLALHEQIFGARHPRLALILINLADVQSSQRHYAAARPLLERALMIGEPVLGAQHPTTLKSLRKLVAVLGNLSKEGDQTALLVAMPLHTCLMALEAAAGTLSQANRQMPGAHQNPVKAAEQLHKLVLQLEAQSSRSPHSAEEQAQLQQARELGHLADELKSQGNYAAAQSRLEEALAIQERVLGADHLDHVDLLKKLAQVREMQGQYSAVLPLIQRVADIHVRVLGLEHPTTLMALSQLMSQYSYEYGLAAALPLQEQILKAKEAMLGPDDLNVRMTRGTLERLQASVAKAAPREKESSTRSRSEKREAALAALSTEREALLVGIENIDWHSLHHAYGPADDVPNLLHLLLSDDESVRDDAWEHLYGSIWHQGTVYEATAYAVPFLLRMLTSDGPPGKAELLGFLAALAEGSSYLATHSDFLSDGAFSLRDSLIRQGRDFDGELQKEQGWVAAVNRAVGEGVSIYLDLLNHEEREIRHLSLAVLVSLRGHSAEIVPRLRSLLTATQDVATRTALVRALHSLMDNSPETQTFFADLMRSGEGKRLTFVAAVALTERTRDQVPEDAINIILSALRDASGEQPDNAEPVMEAFNPIGRDSDLRLVIGALTHLSVNYAVTLLLRVLPLLQGAESALETTSVLLDLVFNEGRVQAKSTALSMQGQGAERRRKVEYWHPKPQAPREAASLTVTQRAVLEAIVSHAPIWEDDHDLLKLYGLPITRESLRQFIAN